MQEENSIQFWANEIEKVMKQAKEYGISSCSVLFCDDPLEDTEEKIVVYVAMGPVLRMGAGQMLISQAAAQMQD